MEIDMKHDTQDSKAPAKRSETNSQDDIGWQIPTLAIVSCIVILSAAWSIGLFDQLLDTMFE